MHLKKYLRYLLLTSLFSGAIAWAVTLPPVVTVHDSLEQRITLSKPAERVVSLSPHLTELLYEVGAGEKIIAVDNNSDYPEAASHLPVVADNTRINIDAIVKLRPDLIVAWRERLSSQELVNLQRLGFVVYVSNPIKITDIADDLVNLGQLTGVADQARWQANQFLSRYRTIQDNYAERTKVQVFYERLAEPLVTIGRGTLIHEAIEMCGGQNIFAKVEGDSPRIDVESVVASKPDVIMGQYQQAGNTDWRKWDTIPAVASDNLFFVAEDSLNRFTPRMLAGIEQMCDYFEKARLTQEEAQPLTQTLS